MKCIVEALADVLSRPHPLPVSQECLITLKTGESRAARLVLLINANHKPGLCGLSWTNEIWPLT